jgi:hypothetical protein
LWGIATHVEDVATQELEERAKKAKQAAQPVSTRAAVFRRSHKYLRISLSVAASRWTRGPR